MTISELVHFSLKPGTNTKNEDFQNVLKTISEQKGCEYIGTGATVENHEDVDMIVEWPDLKHHQDFMAADYYGPFLEKAKSLVSGAEGSLTVNHVHAEPPLSYVASRSPVIEMLLLYLAHGSEDEAATTVSRFLEIAAKNAGSDIKAYTHGPVLEELEKEGVDGKLKGYFVALGWASVDAHMAFRETEVFKEHVPALRALAKGLKVHHTSFTEYEKS